MLQGEGATLFIYMPDSSGAILGGREDAGAIRAEGGGSHCGGMVCEDEKLFRAVDRPDASSAILGGREDVGAIRAEGGGIHCLGMACDDERFPPAV